MLSYYSEEDETAPQKEVCVECRNVKGKKAQFYLLSENKDLELIKEELFASRNFNLLLKVNCLETYLIKFVSVD
jgi:hypothetical protein